MDLRQRAARYAALGDATRLAIVDHLATTDMSPAEIGRMHSLSSNLVAHHLGVLEDAGLIVRVVSAGDKRRRYVRLRGESLGLVSGHERIPAGPILFVCTHNSARSQLAAALWTAQTGATALSAGTQPAAQVHPGAIAAAARAGLDLTGARPQDWNEVFAEDLFVITVCDQAHEELTSRTDHWHWSTPDPVRHPTKRSFDTALRRLRRRITTLTGAR